MPLTDKSCTGLFLLLLLFFSPHYEHNFLNFCELVRQLSCSYYQLLEMVMDRES